MLIEKTDIRIDLEGLRKHYLNNVQNWPQYKSRICLNNHDDSEDYVLNAGQRLIYTEFKYMNSIFKNTIWEDTLKNIPGKIGRARIMNMGPAKLLTMHRDTEARWHIALFTDPSCVAYDLETNQAFHIPSDGYLYKLNARRLHTVFNSSNNVTRTHLVVCEYV